MGDKTKIELAHHSWNPAWGCTKISDECRNCYLGRIMGRSRVPPFQGPVRTGQAAWDKPKKWNRQAIDQMRTTRVVVCGMTDMFHPGIDHYRDEIWREMLGCFALTWIVMTRRPERILDCLPNDWGTGYRNVWLGVSAGRAKNLRLIRELAEVPARVRFLSAEPLLEDITLEHHIELLDWVIAGGESGLDRRPSNVNWYASLHAECLYHGVPFFMKQDSSEREGQQGQIPPNLWAIKEFPENVSIVGFDARTATIRRGP